MANKEKMEEIFVNVIYCDDVRQEVGGKQSLIGVYNSDMILPSFPVTLPKLCTQILVRLPIDTAANNVEVKISNGENVLFEVPIPEGEVQRMSKAMLETDKEIVFLGIGIHFQFAPLQFDQATKIKTVATVDGREIKGNSLVVRLPTQEERAQLGIPT